MHDSATAIETTLEPAQTPAPESGRTPAQEPAQTPAQEPAKVPDSYVTIPEANLLQLEDRVTKLNRRATKLGLAAIEVTEISRETRETYVGRNADGEDVYRSRVWLTLDVQGDKPTVPGWTLVGAIDHQDVANGSLNVLRAGRGEKVPEDYRHACPTCDHCETTRRRRDTFILRDERGAHKQIGRTCLQDFLGEGTTAAQLVGWLKFVREIETFRGDYEGDDYPTERSDYEETGRYLAAVAASVRVDSWTSKGKAYDEGGASTADAAWSVLYPSKWDLEQPNHPKVTADDVEVAEKALAWIRDLPEAERDADYLANLYAACARDGFRAKQAGLVASLAGAAYPRAMRDAEAERRKAAEAEARADKPISKHVGEAKQRLRDLPVTVEKIRGWESHYGYTTFVSMRDASNNLLVWYASGDIADDLPKENEACKLTGTIKKHRTDKYTGEACTSVNRCKLS